MDTLRKKLTKSIILGILLILATSCFLFTGCGSMQPGSSETLMPGTSPLGTEKTAESTGASQTENTSISKPENTPPIEDPGLYAINPLTGVRNMNKANEGKRPIAVMISNIKQANPQNGITACDMFYEIPAEGGIPRIMGLFADVTDIPLIGSIRSTRDYYVQLALGYNAILAHFGTSTSAESMIKKYSMNNLEGMNLADIFPQDPVRLKNMGATHSRVTSGEKISTAIGRKKYDMNTGVGGGKAFDFYNQQDFTVDGTMDCNKVTAEFSGSYTSYFTYDPVTKLYGKHQFNAPHVDDKGAQIKVTNVIVIHTPMKVLDVQKHIEVNLSSGSGYYISGGKAKEIKWSKGADTNPIKYTNMDGSALCVNAGKTYICIVGSASKIILSPT